MIEKLSHRARSMTKQIVSHTESEQDVLDDVVLDEAPSEEAEHVIVDGVEGFPVAEFAVRFWTIGAFLAISLYLFRDTLPLLTLILAAFIISVAIEGPIRFFKRLGSGRGFAIFCCYGGLGVLILAIMMVIPFVVVQVGELVSLLIDVFQQTQTSIGEMGWAAYVESRNFIPGAIKDRLLESFQDAVFVENVQAQLSALIGTWQSWLSNLTTFAWKVTSGFAQTLLQASLVIVLSIFFSIEKNEVMRLLVKTFSKRKSDVPHVHERVIMVYSKLQLWLKGQLFLMLYVGVVVYVGLWILTGFGIDIDKKLLLALMAGVTEIIPYVGPLLGAIPALLVATLSHGVWGFLGTFIVFAFVQWTENNIVVPVVMNKVLGVSALLIFICMLLGGWIFGFVGILLAAPIAVIVAVLGDKNFGKES